MMELREYLNATFSGLILKPILYYQWNIRIHFEMGGGIYQFRDDGELNFKRFNRVYSQALSIVNEIFSDQDEIFLVINVYQRKDYRNKGKKIKVYYQYVKNKNL